MKAQEADFLVISPMEQSSQGKRRLWLVLFLVLGFVAVLLYSFNSHLWSQASKLYEALHHPKTLKKIITGYGAYGPLVYVLIQVAQVVVAPIPGGAIEFLGGYLFGVKVGFFYSMVGLFFGSWLAFGLARIFERVAVEKFVSPETRKKFDYLIGHEGVILSFILFLIPGFPKDALCYILGLTSMHLGIFLLISTFGRIPGTLMACLQGGKAFDHQYITFFILFAVSCVILLVFYVYHEEIHGMIKKWTGVKR